MAGVEGVPTISGYSEFVPVARGGFGQVYKARQDRFDRVVAVKVLEIQSVDERAVARFERECRALGGLSWHPNVVAVYDSGLDHAGRPWLAMEFITGGSLADRLRTDGPLAWSEALAVGVLMCGALGTAHAAGVLHRDIKPDNLLVGRFDEVKLADFGIAAVEGAGATTTGNASFTVAHVAPEVLRNQKADERSDLYELASTLHTLIAGKPPFALPDASIAAQLTEILTVPAPRLEDVPDAFADLVLHTLAKEPDHRPSSAAELGAALQQIQRQHGQPVTALRLEEAPGEGSATGGTGDSSPTVTLGTSDRTAETIHSSSLSPASVAAPAATEAPLESAPEAPTATAHDGAESHGADEAPAAPSRPTGTASARPRSRWKTVAAAVAALIFVGAGVAALIHYAQSNYYVGFDDQGQVAIFQGRPGGFLVFQPKVVETTDILVGDLRAAGNERVTAETGQSSLADAESFVDNLCELLEDGATSTTCGN